MQSSDFSTLRWRKSVRCGPDNHCVELARLSSSEHVGVRDGKSAMPGPYLAFRQDEWLRFTLQTKAGKFDRA